MLLPFRCGPVCWTQVRSTRLAVFVLAPLLAAPGRAILPRTQLPMALSLLLMSFPLLSSAYIFQPIMSCRRLLAHWVPVAFCLALPSAGRSIPARMAIMAMTTSNSMRVKAENEEDEIFERFMCSTGSGLTITKLLFVGASSMPLFRTRGGEIPHEHGI